MKTFIKIIAIALMAFIPVIITAQDKDKNIRSVKFETSISCSGCVNTIMNNIPKEKGVKDVRCNLETKEVEIKYDESKTNPVTLRKSIEKLGYNAKQIEKQEGIKEKKD